MPTLYHVLLNPQIMSNKIKSLLYLLCFVASSFIYYQMEQNFKNENQIVVTEINSTDSEKLAELDSEKLEDF